MSEEKKGNREEEIVRRFASVADLKIDPTSIRKLIPPQPDIICQTFAGEWIHFELAEIVDPDIRRDTQASLELPQLVRAEFNRQTADAPPGLYDGIRLFIDFDDRASNYKRRAAIPGIVSAALRAGRGFAGKLELDGTLAKVARRASLSWKTPPPMFICPEVTAFAEATPDTVATKFEKTYEADGPLELLAYHDVGPPLPVDVWLPGLRDVLRGLESSPFRRVWVFDLGTNAVLFVHPQWAQSENESSTM